ncbi:hypothetical protein [Natrialbaceae archaeon AArc-T1-2]|uniref:hypothetical protein n=1 Tax=Natrialbaceae archaeon AArc-T1-2 TaxID=3053904 RepID=UPI00255AA751|nr:hypothetical protein [Natrialbaceae archaeon AArc-T1-2]WIV66767.1 hypothetical protein QQ977_13885 [Natrialbaceae archaeon AArc-T1-2]
MTETNARSTMAQTDGHTTGDRTTSVEATIRAELSKHRELHVTDLSRRLEEHPATVEKACHRLARQGKLVAVGCGTFSNC